MVSWHVQPGRNLWREDAALAKRREHQVPLPRTCLREAARFGSSDKKEALALRRPPECTPRGAVGDYALCPLTREDCVSQSRRRLGLSPWVAARI